MVVFSPCNGLCTWHLHWTVKQHCGQNRSNSWELAELFVSCLLSFSSGTRETDTRTWTSPHTTHTHTHTHTHTQKDRDPGLPVWCVWGMFLLQVDLWWQTEGNETQRDIYRQCQSLLSCLGKWGQLEILAENWVLSTLEEGEKKRRKQKSFCVT